MSKIIVGDTIFNRSGDPGVVIAKNELNGDLDVQNKGEVFEKTRKIGFINGLPVEERKEFESVMVDIRKDPKPHARVEALTEKIEELKKDPRKFLITKYLNAEKAHIINSEGIKVDGYKINENDI